MDSFKIKQNRSYFISSIKSDSILSSRLGQPSHNTHPHLLKDDEITPGMTKEAYERRRARFLEGVPAGSICLFPSALHAMMSNDIPYPYRQNNDFAYLTGFEEPGSLLVLKKNDLTVFSTIFLRPRSAHSEIWDGPRTGVERVSEAFGINSAINAELINTVLPDIIESASNIYFNDIPTNIPGLSEIIKSFPSIPLSDTKIFMSRLRLIKTSPEIELMRKSCKISAQSFEQVMRATPPLASEHVLSAEIEYECRIRGAQRLSYPPVVATGISCNTLHYINNDSIAKAGDLVLMDAAGEYFNYASDITRTWPCDGKFTEPQKIVYEAVLRVQKIIISLCKPILKSKNGTIEKTTLSKLHLISVSLLEKELQKIGISDPQTISRCYPHMIGHYLGMDTHDCPYVGYDEPLLPGMIITVEPGLYIPAINTVPEQYRGIGVRIEDDILITSEEPEILTIEAPKEVEHLESIIGTKLKN